MKFISTQSDLSRALSTVSKIIRSGALTGQDRILESVLIRAQGKKLYILTTNLEISIEYSIDVQVVNEGSVAIPAKLLESYVSLVPASENIEFSVVNTLDVEIKTPSSETLIKGLNPDLFPSIPHIDNEGKIIVQYAAFKDTVSKVIYSASTNSGRPVLTGVYVGIRTDDLVFVGTDSYRLSEKTCPVVKIETGLTECIVPAQTMNEVCRAFLKDDEDLDITLSKNQIQFTQAGIRIVSRLLSEKFPDYKQIIPKKLTSRGIVNTSELLLALKRASLLTEDNHTVKIELAQLSNGPKVILTSLSAERGSGRIEVPCSLEGEDIFITLNSQYLIEFLSRVGTEFIYIDIESKVTPAILRPKEKNDYLYLVMPLKSE